MTHRCKGSLENRVSIRFTDIKYDKKVENTILWLENNAKELDEIK